MGKFLPFATLPRKEISKLMEHDALLIEQFVFSMATIVVRRPRLSRIDERQTLQKSRATKLL